MLRIFKHCIDIAYDSVPEKDYNVWVVAFEDAAGNELYRQDVLQDEITRLQSSTDTYIKIWRQFNTFTQPHKYIFWPHSESKGWMDKRSVVI